MILEKLCDFEDLASWIRAIEPRNVELHTMQRIVRWRCLPRRQRRQCLRLLLIRLELRHSVEEIINLRIHGKL